MGAWGEDLALRYLIKHGYRLVERNYRTRRGEIDLIVRKEEALVFVEVKLRSSTSFGDPLEAVTPRKQAIPPATLRCVVRNSIERHMNPEKLHVMKLAEEQERDVLREGWGRTA